MPRLRNGTTGVVVSVDDATAARLGPGWVPADSAPVEPKQAPRRTTPKKK